MSAFIKFVIRVDNLDGADELRELIEGANIPGATLYDERCENVAGDSCSEWDMPRSVN